MNCVGDGRVVLCGMLRCHPPRTTLILRLHRAYHAMSGFVTNAIRIIEDRLYALLVLHQRIEDLFLADEVLQLSLSSLDQQVMSNEINTLVKPLNSVHK